MDPDVIVNHCLERLDGTVAVESWGERGIFYNPDGRLKRGVYVLTIKEKDGDNDCSSQLDRQGVWRVNIGVRKSTFRTMFGEIPARPPKGGTVDAAHDFSALDCIMPHLCVDGLDMRAESHGTDFRCAAAAYRRGLCVCQRKVWPADAERIVRMVTACR